MYLRIAKVIAQRSSCRRLKVGSVIVKNTQIISEGYNGTITGQDNTCESLMEVWYDNVLKEPTRDIPYHYSNTGHVVISSSLLTNPNAYKPIDNPSFDKHKIFWGSHRYLTVVKGGDRVGVLPNGDGLVINVYSLLFEKYGYSELLKTSRIIPIDDTLPDDISNLMIVDGYGKEVVRIPTDLLPFETKCEVVHAEVNAIYKLAKSSNNGEGATIYCTDSPCIDCSKAIIQSGIVRVVYDKEYRVTEGLELLRNSGVQVERLQDENL